MNPDLRFKKTEKLIFNAFEKLLAKKSIEDISVKELCTLGEISRHSFYSHYYDKYELLKKYSDVFIDKIIDDIEISNKDCKFSEALKKTAIMIFQYLSDNVSTTNRLIKNDAEFWQRLNTKMQSLSIKFSNNSERFQVYAIYSSSALVNCLCEYFSGNIKINLNDYINYIIEIALKCNDFMNDNQQY